MNALSKMAAVGQRDFVQIFGTCGFDIFYTDTESPADIAIRWNKHENAVLLN